MLILSASDLKPLVDDLGQLEGAFQGIEAAVVRQHRAAGGHAGWVDLPLGETDEVLGVFLTSYAAAASIRVWDSAARHHLDRGAQLMLLLDPVNARPRALLAGVDLNPLRTSVPAAVGAKYLAPPGARVLGILGSGEQARAHARAMSHALPALERIHVWSPTAANRQRFASETAAVLELPVSTMDDPAEALAAADVVTLTTPRGKPEIDAAWFKRGALVVAIVGVASSNLLHQARTFVPSHTRPNALAVPARFQGSNGTAGRGKPAGWVLARAGRAAANDGLQRLPGLCAREYARRRGLRAHPLDG